MGLLADIRRYGRFSWGLRQFLRHTISLEEARAISEKQLAEREINFLHLVRKGILGYPKSPYLALLKSAQCEMIDIEEMVKSRGLENTLRAMREAGIYITYEEFKGHKPIIRDGKILSEGARLFDNPYLHSYYEAKTGASTGIGTRVAVDLSHIRATAPFQMLAYDPHGLLGIPTGIWRGILPDVSGLHSILNLYHFGQLPRKWFSPITRRDYRPSIRNWGATHAAVLMGRVWGVPIPWPEPVALDNAKVIAQWASRTVEANGACHMNSHVSLALRVALAAHREGLDLTGVTFSGGGEPPTPVKVREITRTGAKYIPNYFLAETGVVGFGCANPLEINDLHLFKGGLALIQYPRKVPAADISVNAFYFTTLLPTAPKLMLNVESDDYGLLETRSCGCPLERYGYTEHISRIRSYSKLTGEGVTLVGSEMLRILEEVLPSRFGGSPLDYQLLEEEDEQGFTRLHLLVSPKIEISDESEVIQVMLEALRRSSGAGDLARAIWNRAGTFQIKRREPFWTDRGKLMPLHLNKHSAKDR